MYENIAGEYVSKLRLANLNDEEIKIVYNFLNYYINIPEDEKEHIKDTIIYYYKVLSNINNKEYKDTFIQNKKKEVKSDDILKKEFEPYNSLIRYCSGKSNICNKVLSFRNDINHCENVEDKNNLNECFAKVYADKLNLNIIETNNQKIEGCINNPDIEKSRKCFLQQEYYMILISYLQTVFPQKDDLNTTLYKHINALEKDFFTEENLYKTISMLNDLISKLNFEEAKSSVKKLTIKKLVENCYKILINLGIESKKVGENIDISEGFKYRGIKYNEPYKTSFEFEFETLTNDIPKDEKIAYCKNPDIISLESCKEAIEIVKKESRITLNDTKNQIQTIPNEEEVLEFTPYNTKQNWSDIMDNSS